MNAPKLTLTEQVVASAAAKPFKPVNITAVVRGTIWAGTKAALLVLFALNLDGWLSIAAWTLFALAVIPHLFLSGLAGRLKDEYAARLALLGPTEQQVMSSSTRLARHWVRQSDWVKVR